MINERKPLLKVEHLEQYFKFGINVTDEQDTVCDKSLVRTNKSYDL